MEKTISTSEAAKKTGIHPVTLRRWLASKAVRPQIQPSVAVPIDGKTLWRWTAPDVERLRAYKGAHYRKGRGRKKVAVAEPQPTPLPKPTVRPKPKAKAKRGPRRKQSKMLTAILELVKGYPSGISRDRIPAAAIGPLGLKHLDEETLRVVERSIGELASEGLVQIKAGMVYPA